MWQHLLTCFVKKLYPQMRAPAKIFLAEPDKAGISRWWKIKIQIYHLMFCASLTKHLKLNVVQSKLSHFKRSRSSFYWPLHIGVFLGQCRLPTPLPLLSFVPPSVFRKIAAAAFGQSKRRRLTVRFNPRSLSPSGVGGRAIYLLNLQQQRQSMPNVIF